MRFPGHRIAKHYFPVTKKRSRLVPLTEDKTGRWFLLGLDQVIVDMEVIGERDWTAEFGIQPGESVLLSREEHDRLLKQLGTESLRKIMVAGGTVANTLNNFTYLSGEPAVLLGAIDASIQPKSPAFCYVAQTPPAVDLSRLVPRNGHMAIAVTFVGQDGDRSFAVAPGISNEYAPDDLPSDVIENAGAVLTSLYCLRDPRWPIAQAAIRLMERAHASEVPVALGMGTAGLVNQQRELARELLARFVTVAAMNAAEASALTGEDDVLLACEKVLDWTDVVIITEGSRGLTMGGYVDEAFKRETDQKIRSKSIPEYNRYEYSRLMQRKDCREPRKVYSHTHPYRGGPDRLMNTSGAGDAALAAFLHDMLANQYHRTTVPESDKHTLGVEFLTYSSLSRNAQYGNRVAYEVLKGRSPRLVAPVGPDEELKT